jgi:glycosyltransferase involved in cell wall biosynthesis
MPAYNPGELIKEAVESAVNGTYPCDVFIIDDGSTIPISSMLGAFPRTRVIRLDRNKGVVHARNVGLKAILAEPYDFVACLDADDVCHPDRVARQVEFLDRHPEVAVVGAWARFTEESSDRTVFIHRTPDSPEGVKKALYSNSAIVNSSAMMRTSVLRELGLYSEDYPVAEDYELFRRISQRFEIANIPSVLVRGRISLGGLSLTYRRRQLFDRLRIQLKYFQPSELGAWTGMVKTVLLFLFPTTVLRMIKALKERFGDLATEDPKRPCRRMLPLN